MNQLFNLPIGAFFLPTPHNIDGYLMALPLRHAKQFDDNLFSVVEKERERKYVRLNDKLRHRAAHGLKRFVLASFLGCLPEELQFLDDDNGKPYLLLNGIRSPIAFNLSHSGDWVVLGVSLTMSVGVDVETSDGNSISNLIDVIKHPNDPDVFEETSFYRLWVMKEACVKATGSGLRQPLKDFSVTVLTPKTYQASMPLGAFVQGFIGRLPDGTPFSMAVCD